VDDSVDYIDSIYEASAVPSLWPSVLEKLARRADAALGSLYIAEPDGSFRWIGTEEATRLFNEFMALKPPLEPIRIRKADELVHDGFYTDLDFNDPAVFEHPVYTEFLYPRNYGWHAAARFELPTGESVSIGFERYRDRGVFEPSVIQDLNALRPHLGRAAVMTAQLSLERTRGMTAALDAVGIPAAVLKRGGALFVANEQFQKLVPAVVLDRNQRVAIADTRADALLADAIARLAVRNASGQSRSIPVAARDGRPPLIFHVLPVRGAANDIFAKGLALLMVTPVDRSAVPSAEVLRALFDLTPAEARVARGIGQAKTVETVALESGVSRETVRTQLAAVLAKTGMTRQAELVALLGGKVLATD
jgi:DNA-binding CsgD family transcriptional regulator